MLFPCHLVAARQARLPLWLSLLGLGWWWLVCLAVAPGQEPHRPEPHRTEPHRTEPHRTEPQRTGRVPMPGEVVRSISIRVTDGQPRFVVAARVVEEVDEHGPHDAHHEHASYLVPLEPPPEIVEYFKRTAQETIAEIDRQCGLSEQQKAKLELAAMGDMSRLVRESRDMRQQYSGVALHNQHRNLTVLKDVAQINTRLSEGVLRDGSMFLRVLRSLLTAGQLSQLAEARFFEQSTAWPIELSDDQRLQLWRLVQRTHAPHAPPLLWSSKHCRTLLAELPRRELVSFLGEAKAETLAGWCRR